MPRRISPLGVVTAFAAVTPLSPSPALAQSAPAGWTTARAAGGVVVYTPPDLKPGEVYSVAIFPRASLNGRSLEDWAVTAAGGDPVPPGTPVGPPTVTSRREHVVVAGRSFAAGGRRAVGLYTAVSMNGQTAQVMRIAWTGNLYGKYKGDTLPLIQAVGRSLMRGAAGSGTQATRTPAPRPDVAPPKRRTAASHPLPASPPPARPGMGVKPSQIAGVYAQPSYGTGAGGGLSVSYEPVLALKDGTYCEHFEVPPSDLDAAASRRSHPRQWGRWRGGGGHTETLNEKGVWEKSGWIGPLPSPPPRLSGKYTNVSGGGNTALGGDVMIAIQKSFTFSPDGRFRSGSDTSASSSAVVAGSSRKGNGTYTVSGYAITLRSQDGTVRRWSYARTADGLLFLGGDAYIDDK